MKDTVFQAILKPLTPNLVAECTRRFKADHGCKKLFMWQHLQAMIYAQLTEMKSLSTLEVAINSQQIGIGCLIKRATLSDANQRRQAACFFWVLKQLMSLGGRKKRQELEKVVRLLDSSPIQLKGFGYDDWAKEVATRRCQGLKLHVEYDMEIEAPTRMAMSYPNYNDVSMGKQWPLIPDTVYVFDKGYYDFNWWWHIHQQQAFFVTRLKKNVAIVMQKNQEKSSESILEDGTFTFKHKKPRGGKVNLYQAPLRRISVYREGKKPLILVTNLMDISAEIIAELYKARWEIELFFKWIKQNLKLKKFLGKSENAVKIQIATAMIAYLLVQLYKNQTENNQRLQLVLVWIRYNLHLIVDKPAPYPPPLYPSLYDRPTVYL